MSFVSVDVIPGLLSDFDGILFDINEIYFESVRGNALIKTIAAEVKVLNYVSGDLKSFQNRRQLNCQRQIVCPRQDYKRSIRHVNTTRNKIEVVKIDNCD